MALVHEVIVVEGLQPKEVPMAKPAGAFRRANHSGYLVEPGMLLAALATDGIIPAFDQVIAEHITYAYPDRECAPSCDMVTVVGYVRSDGVDCAIVEVDGTTIRPDGRTFHVTISVAEGHKPVESNAAIASVEATPVGPHDLTVTAF